MFVHVFEVLENAVAEVHRISLVHLIEGETDAWLMRTKSVGNQVDEARQAAEVEEEILERGDGHGWDGCETWRLNKK